MMAGGVDLALRFGPPHPSALIARKILETRINVANASRHPVAASMKSGYFPNLVRCCRFLD
jgi:DNA-binding transcriptional LysR family regulator